MARVNGKGKKDLVRFYGSEIEALELFGVVEILAHRIGLGGMLAQDIQIQPVRPPVPDRGAAARCMTYRAFIVRHRVSPFVLRTCFCQETP